MSGIGVLINYNGHWNENNEYTNYEEGGIIIPENCNYGSLLSILYDFLKASIMNADLKIECQAKSKRKPIVIKDDMGVHFFLSLKKNEEDMMAYLLYVSIKIQDSTLHC